MSVVPTVMREFEQGFRPNRNIGARQRDATSPFAVVRKEVSAMTQMPNTQTPKTIPFVALHCVALPAMLSTRRLW